MNLPKRVTIGLGLSLLAATASLRGDKVDPLIESRAALEHAKVALPTAVERAMRATFNPTLIQAALQWQDDGLAYQVDFFSGLTLKQIEVDAVSGDVRPDLERVMNPEDEAYAALRKAARDIKTSTADALKTATDTSPGLRPYKVTLEIERGRPTYEVELLGHGKAATVLIDAANGKVLDEDVRRAAGLTANWDFDDRNVRGKLPPGWRVHQTGPGKLPATWMVVRDRTAPSRSNVLALTRTQNEGDTFNLAVAERVAFGDLELRVHVKADSGSEDQGGGPIWRFQDENNYYVCRFNPLEGNYRVYKVVDGRRQQLLSADVETEAGRWYAIRVVMRGDRILCFLDAKRLLDVRDDTFKKAGKIGLWTKADAVTSFDDLEVREVDARGRADKD